LGQENGSVPVLVAGHAQGQLLITAAAELEMAADGDFLQLELHHGPIVAGSAGQKLSNGRKMFWPLFRQGSRQQFHDL